MFEKQNYFWFFLGQKQIESHQYYNQVKMDVVRTLKRFPPRKL